MLIQQLTNISGAPTMSQGLYRTLTIFRLETHIPVLRISCLVGEIIKKTICNNSVCYSACQSKHGMLWKPRRKVPNPSRGMGWEWRIEDFMEAIVPAEELARQKNTKMSFQYREETSCVEEIRVAKFSCHIRLQIGNWWEGWKKCYIGFASQVLQVTTS